MNTWYFTLIWSAKHTAHNNSKSSINPTTKETRAQISKSGITCLNNVCRASVMHPFTQIFWLYKKVKGREKKSSIWHLVKQWTLSSLIFFFINKFVEKKRINLLILERVIKELWGFEANLFLDISIMVPIKD